MPPVAFLSRKAAPRVSGSKRFAKQSLAGGGLRLPRIFNWGPMKTLFSREGRHHRRLYHGGNSSVMHTIGAATASPPLVFACSPDWGYTGTRPPLFFDSVKETLQRGFSCRCASIHLPRRARCKRKNAGRKTARCALFAYERGPRQPVLTRLGRLLPGAPDIGGTGAICRRKLEILTCFRGWWAHGLCFCFH